jgi:hypothetical protein
VDDTLHKRIAEALGWTVEETQSFDLAALRDLVRSTHPKLAYVISDVIQRGDHILVPVTRKRRRV